MMRSGGGDGQRRGAVLAKYEVLAGIYASAYPGHEAPGHPRSEMPPHLANLLPVYDGWCFSPNWEAPRPVEHWAGHFRDDVNRQAVVMPSWAVTRLAAIETDILGRSEDYRLVLHANRLLRQAADEARLEVPTELDSRLNWRRGRGFLPLTDYIAALKEAQTRAAWGSAVTEEDRLNDRRLRLDWLGCWGDLTQINVRLARRRSGVYSETYQVQKSVGVNDIAEVHGLYIRTSETHGAHPTELLGHWYLTLLRRCGATKREEERIWRVNMANAQRRPPQVLTANRVWGRIALKRLANHVNYCDRREDAVQE